MRVVTFNVEHARLGGGDVPDADALASAVLGLEPDLVAFQEIDQGDPTSGGVDQPGVVAAALSGTAAFAPRYPGGGTGVAIVARGPIDDVEVRRFLTRRQPKIKGRIMLPPVHPKSRVVLFARVTVGGMAISVANAHLELVREVSHVQLERVVGALCAREEPRLLVGDLNRRTRWVAATVAGGGLELLADDTPTHPVDRPVRRIDHIATGGLRVLHSEVVRLPVGDHRALVADLEPA
jgi:endonuclease/exonuclease/phosphatase family metal-dependent hydrolase